MLNDISEIITKLKKNNQNVTKEKILINTQICKYSSESFLSECAKDGNTISN